MFSQGKPGPSVNQSKHFIMTTGYCGNETIHLQPQVTHVIQHSDRNVQCLWTVTSRAGTKIHASIREFPQGCHVTFSTSSHLQESFHNSHIIRTVHSSFSRKAVYPTSITSNNGLMWIAMKCSPWGYSDLLIIEVHQYTDIGKGILSKFGRNRKFSNTL